MKKIRNLFDFLSVIKYGTIFLLFLILNSLEQNFYPYSISIFTTALFENFSLLSTSILFFIALLFCGGKTQISPTLISVLILIVMKFFHRKEPVKIKFVLPVFVLISMIPFVILGDAKTFITYDKRIFVCIISSFLTLLTAVAFYALDKKGLKYKYNFEETVSIVAIVIVVGLGLCNFISPLMWKGVVVFLTLLICYFYSIPYGTFISCILSCSLAVFYSNIEYLSIGLLWGISADVCMRFSRHLSSVVIIAIDFFIFSFFKVSPYILSQFLPTLIGALLFAIIPTPPLDKIKNKLNVFREKNIVKQTINRNRLMLSNKLYEISGVFSEMSSAFTVFKKTQLDETKAKNSMLEQVKGEICAHCNNYLKCKKFEKETKLDILKMIDIGVAKGKLSLIDLPVSLADRCTRSSDIIFGLNKMLTTYRNYIENATSLSSGRDLIASETSGIAEILKELALETGTQLKYQSTLEKTLTLELFKNGFIVSELLIYGSNENTTISMIISMKEFALNKLIEVIEKVTSIKMQLADKNSITTDKCYMSFRADAPCDAVFGIAKAVKDGSIVSGDTHSVTKINEGKFLVALSDGMGSGENAQNVSSVSLSLIESFYKAGMDSGLILNTVNKLLSVNVDESFTALDVSVIDLNTRKADFIKYGAPYGFIINDTGVKIIEASTLPLGILEDLKPSVCSTVLESGDMVLLITDGIADAFKSSSEIIDYLRKVPAKNPQALADDILSYALKLDGEKKNDDMTALAVRIFDKYA